MCFVGDRVIDSASPKVFDTLIARTSLGMGAASVTKANLSGSDSNKNKKWSLIGE
jgi:hypothetical protein